MQTEPMTTKETIEKWKQLSDEEKKSYQEMGYVNHEGKHYGEINSFILYMSGARPGMFIPVSSLIKLKKFNFKGAKTFGVLKPVIKENEQGESEMFGWAGRGRVVHVDDIKDAKPEVVQQEVLAINRDK